MPFGFSYLFIAALFGRTRGTSRIYHAAEPLSIKDPTTPAKEPLDEPERTI